MVGNWNATNLEWIGVIMSKIVIQSALCLLLTLLVFLFIDVRGVSAKTRTENVCGGASYSLSYESEHFYIAYSTIEGGLTIEDYAEALEAAYEIVVSTYGWAAPPLCTAASCEGNANPWGKYPVMVTDSPFLGTLARGDTSGYVIGDNPNTAVVESFSETSCIILANDFSRFGSDNQLALRGIAAHEYIHAIQYGYGDDNKYASGEEMWYESTAVYMEDEVVDESVIDHIFLWPEVDNCLARWSEQSNPYSNFPLFRYVAERAGGTHISGGGEDVIQTLWENVAALQSPLTAFENAVQAKGFVLNSLFHEYAISLKFSQSCNDGYTEPYCFSEGDSYRATADSEIETHGTMKSILVNRFDGAIKDDFSINWIELSPNAHFSLTLENRSPDGAFQGSVACDTGSDIRVTPFPKSSLGGGEQTQISEIDTSGCVEAVVVITNHARSNDRFLCEPRSYKLVRTFLTEPNQPPQPNRLTAYLPMTFYIQNP